MRGHYVRTPEMFAWTRTPWTCPKCNTLMTKAGHATHLKFCEPPADKFWRNVEKGDGCWIYTKSAKPDGYRFFRYREAPGGKQVQWYAHRFSWMLANGKAPDDMEVAHKCDNRGCVRPDHLFLATHDENMKDMRHKGRGTGALTIAQVREIKALLGTMKQKEIAAKFGVKHGVISKLKVGKSYAYAPPPQRGRNG